MSRLGSKSSRAPWLRCVLLLVLFSAGLGLTLALRKFEERGVVYFPADAHPIANVPVNRFGVNAKLEEDVTQDQLERDFAAIKVAGFGWVRLEVQWSQLEPDSRGVYWDSKFNRSSWDKWDRIVALAQRDGIQIIARIDRPPLWSQPRLAPLLREHPDWQGPPESLADYGDVVAAFAGRYRGAVRYIQVWNEPNLRNEWAGEPVNPARYAALLRVAAERARAADPDVVILAASLAPNVEAGPRFGYANMSDLLFLQGMYDAKAAPYFDVVVANPYGLQHGPYDDRSIGPRAYQFPRAFLRPPQPFDFSRPIAARQVMERNGDRLKPIWAGEFGWNTVPPDWKGNPSPWGSVTVQQQATYTEEAYQRALREWPWMGVMNLWYLREPVDVDPRDPTPYFAILHQDWSPTPAYDRVRAVAAQPPREYTGAHPATSGAARYGFAGAWRSEPSADRAWAYQVAGAPEANLTFDFVGSVLGLVVRTAPNGGRTFLQVDGSPNLVDALPTDAQGNAYLDTYSPQPRDGVYVDVARNLPDGPHRLTAVIKGAKSPASSGTDVAVAAYVVGTRPWAGWSYLLGTEALGTALCIGWLVVRCVQWLWATGPVAARLGATASVASDGLGWLWAAARASHDGAVSADGQPATPAGAAWRRIARADGAAFAGMIVLGAVYYVSPSAGLSALMLALVAVGALVRLDLALLLAVPAAPLAFLPKHVAGLQLEPQETAILVCAGAWIVQGYWRGALEIRWSRFVWYAVALVAIGFVSLFAATFLRYSLRELRLVILEPALWFVMVASVLAPRRRWMLAAVLVATGTAVALDGLLGLAFGHNVIATEGVRRIAAVYPSPDNVALFLDRIAPVAAAVALFGAAPRRWWYAAGAAAMLAAILLTFSKGSWIAIIAACAVLGIRNRGAAIAAATALVACAVAALALPFTRVRLLGATSMERIWLWQAALAMIRDHPVRGIGLDQFLYLYPTYRLPEAWREPFLSHPHNVILDFWLRLGLPGLLWLGATCAEIGRQVTSAMRVLAASDKALAMGLLSGLAAALAHGLVDNSFFLPDLALIFWAYVALLDLLARPEPEQRSVTLMLSGSRREPAPAPQF